MAFARDIGSYLAGDPVEAGPPSATYKLRKLRASTGRRWRRRWPSRDSCCWPSVISTYLAIQAARAEAEARRQAMAAEIAGETEPSTAEIRPRAAEGAKTKKSEAKARQSEAEAKAVLEFFQTKVLAAARPKDEEGGLGMQATIRDAVDAAVPAIEKSFAGQARDRSIDSRHARPELPVPEDLAALAIRHHESALALRRRVLGGDHPDTLTSMSSLATALWSAGRLAEAVTLHEDTLKRRQARLGPDHPDTLESMGSLAVAYHDAGRLAVALPLYEQTLKRHRTKLGPDHPDTLTSMNNLASAYQDAGRLADALPLFEEALKQRQATLAPDHPSYFDLDEQPGSGLPRRRPQGRCRATARRNAQETEVRARGRPCRHADLDEQPRPGLPRRRPACGGDPALRGNAEAAAGDARPRPPRDVEHDEQSGSGLP